MELRKKLYQGKGKKTSPLPFYIEDDDIDIERGSKLISPASEDEIERSIFKTNPELISEPDINLDTSAASAVQKLQGDPQNNVVKWRHQEGI